MSLFTAWIIFCTKDAACQCTGFLLKEKEKENKRSIAIIPVPDWVRFPERECGGWNVVEYVEASVVAECTTTSSMITVST